MDANHLPPSKTLYDVWEKLGSIDTKLDRVVADSGDQGRRLAALENSKAFERGVTAALGALAGFFSGVITKHLGF